MPRGTATGKCQCGILLTMLGFADWQRARTTPGSYLPAMSRLPVNAQLFERGASYQGHSLKDDMGNSKSYPAIGHNPRPDGALDALILGRLPIPGHGAQSRCTEPVAAIWRASGAIQPWLSCQKPVVGSMSEGDCAKMACRSWTKPRRPPEMPATGRHMTPRKS
jgi:hypothetical protein